MGTTEWVLGSKQVSPGSGSWWLFVLLFWYNIYIYIYPWLNQLVASQHHNFQRVSIGPEETSQLFIPQSYSNKSEASSASHPIHPIRLSSALAKSATTCCQRFILAQAPIVEVMVTTSGCLTPKNKQWKPGGWQHMSVWKRTNLTFLNHQHMLRVSSEESKEKYVALMNITYSIAPLPSASTWKGTRNFIRSYGYPAGWNSGAGDILW